MSNCSGKSNQLHIVHCTNFTNVYMWNGLSHMSISHGALLHWQEPRVKRYLDKAKECELLAAQAREPDVKAALAEISQQWRELARQVEWLEHDRD